MNLEEISNTEALLKLMGYFYSDAEKYRSILEQIIQVVHCHTLAVELSARLLENGISEPVFLLNKLKEERLPWMLRTRLVSPKTEKVVRQPTMIISTHCFLCASYLVQKWRL